jgi:hypothetical protein
MWFILLLFVRHSAALNLNPQALTVLDLLLGTLMLPLLQSHRNGCSGKDLDVAPAAHTLIF